MPKTQPIYFKLLLFSFVILAGVLLSKHNNLQAGSLGNVSVTMSNSRLSYRGKTSAASGTITDIAIDDADSIADYTDTNPGTDITDVLKVNDTLNFGTPAVPVTRTIEEIIDADTIALDNSVTHPDDFFLAEKSVLTVSFVTSKDLQDGSFQLMVPAKSSGGADGIPDQSYFDYDTDTATVACSGTSHTFGTQSGASSQSVSGYSGTWHVYTCEYTGGDDGQTITMTVTDVINPMPDTTHDTGTADTYDVYVRHLDSTDAEIDVTRLKIGVIEAVKVSATVVPSLTFTIAGASSGASMCGVTSDVTTTASTVPFGELETTTFYDATQTLDVATNADDGAAVTALIYDELGLDGVACTGTNATQFDCIFDADVASMTHETAQDWTNASTQTGFGYSLEDSAGTATEAFSYDDSAGTFMAKHFADYNRGSSSQDAQTLYTTNSNPTDTASIKVCYRISVNSTRAAGNYYSYITYTATATF